MKQPYQYLLVELNGNRNKGDIVNPADYTVISQEV